MTGAALLRPTALGEAVEALDSLGPDGAPLAGGTWVMRAPIRGESHVGTYVSLRGLQELRGVERGEDVSLGASLTHAELAVLEDGDGSLAALVEAARVSAFPAVRNVATLGGNLAARGFPEADLAPALLALDASVDVVSRAGPERLSLDRYLDGRPAGLISRVRVPAPSGRRSSFRRLTVRGGGEYSICSVAVAIDLDSDGCVAQARVAAGAVDERARLLVAAAAALEGASPGDAEAARAAGEAGAQELPVRDGLDAPGWYRLAVLPALVRDALSSLTPEATP